MRKLRFLFIAFLFSSLLPAQNLDTSGWVPNNIVEKMYERNDTIYMVGGFTQWGPNHPFGEVVDSLSGIVNEAYPRPNGVVLATEPDGRGGYFIGGGFTQVGDSLRTRIAHIDNTGHVSAWKANVTSGTGVHSLYFDGTNLYAGGQFTVIGGQSRNNLAEIDTLGNILSWNPNSNSIVDKIVKSGSKVYVAGFFSTIGGQPRNYLAQLDAATGLATPWNPNPDNYANGGLQPYGDRVFVSGNFANIGSAARNSIAALDTITGLALPFNLVPTGGFQDILASGDSLFLCGSVTVINGQPRPHLAVVDTAGNLRSWSPVINGTPYKLLLSGNTLYAGGVFSLADSTRRNNVCAFDIHTGQLTSWDPSCGNEVDDLCQTAHGICIAGRYVCINTIDRRQLCAYDVNAHAFTPLQMGLNPFAGGQVQSLVVSANRIYVGGSFDYVNNQVRRGLAALDRQTGNLLPWNPNPSVPSVYGTVSMALKDSVIYVAGNFNNIGGQPRSNLACLDTVTGNALPWHPTPSSTVRNILIHDSLIYICGNFSTVGSQPHSRVAAVSLATGLPRSWNPSVSGGSNQANNIHLLDTTVIVTGFFTTANSQTRNNVAAFGITSGALLPMNPNLNSGVDFSVLNNSGSALYMSGQFTQVGSIARNKIAVIDGYSGNLRSWDIQADMGGLGFIVDSNKVWVAGFFYNLDNKPHAYFLGVDPVPDTMILTSVKPQQENSSFSVFPNPSHGKITMQLENSFTGSCEAAVYNIHGQLVMTQHVNAAETSFDFSGFDPGVYFLRVTSEDGSVSGTARVVVAK